MDYRAISIRIDGDGVRISIPGTAPDKFHDILRGQGFEPLSENSQQWRAPLSAKNWVLTRLYPKFKEHGALVFYREDYRESEAPASSDDTIQSLVKEVERLKKLSNELDKRLSALKKKR